MDIAETMTKIAVALPDRPRGLARMVRDVCLTVDENGLWTALAGGHPSVHIGEFGGEYEGWGHTAEEALELLAKHVRERKER